MDNGFCQMYYVTISPQPIEIHVTNLLWVFVHEPDGRPPPVDGGLPPVLVGDRKGLLTTQPSLVAGEELEVALDVIQDCILGVFQPRFEVVNVPLQATVNMAA